MGKIFITPCQMFITWNKNLPIVFSAIHHTAVSLKYNLYINCLPHESNSWWMLIKDLYQHCFLYTPIILQLIRTLVDTSLFVLLLLLLLLLLLPNSE